MILEQLIFTVISFAIFVYMFFRMIKNNDTTYVIILVLEAIGIALNFLEVLFDVKLNIILVILKYILSMMLPIIIVLLERKGMNFDEFLAITRAKFFLMLGNDKKAKQILINLVTKRSQSYKAHKMLAQIYELEGGMRKAIDEYVQAVDINKKDYASYYRIAELLNSLDKKDEAAQMLFTLLGKKPEMLEATNLLGEILLEQERYKEAVTIYQEALKFNPLNYDINYNLGIAYTMLNDFQNAKLCYEKAAEINSLSYHAKYYLAEIALIYKELEEAEQKFLEAIEDEILSADGYLELSKIKLIRGDKESAIKYANIAIDQNPKKIVEKIKNDSIFIPIIARISIPFNLENCNQELEEKSKKEKIKEKRAKEHLEKMCEITRHLSYADITLLKNTIDYKTETKEKTEIQKERE